MGKRARSSAIEGAVSGAAIAGALRHVAGALFGTKMGDNPGSFLARITSLRPTLNRARGDGLVNVHYQDHSKAPDDHASAGRTSA